MERYYVIAFSEQDFRVQRHLSMYEAFGRARDCLAFSQERLGLVYSVMSARLSEELARSYGSHFGLFFVLDRIVEHLQAEAVSVSQNIIGTINGAEIPREANCRLCHCR